MGKNQKDNRSQENDKMSKEKTNEDYNNQKPNPNDPNQKNQNNEIEMKKAIKINKNKTAAPSNYPSNSNGMSKTIKQFKLKK